MASTTFPTTDFGSIEHFTVNTEDDTIEQTTKTHLRRRKREIYMPNEQLTQNNEYTMEVLVAVDRRMQEYHRENIKQYVLTLMSIVSSIYADPSIGNSINVAVVHILLLKDDLHVDSNRYGELASSESAFSCASN